jgi:hypothetical protein
MCFAGHRLRRPNNKFISLEKRLQTLKAQYDAGAIDAIQYITGVSYNLTERR